MSEPRMGRDPFTQRPTGDRNSLVPERVGDYRRAHSAADTDDDRAAIHHTLGSGPNQAASGDHKHSEYALKAIEINNVDWRINGFSGNLQVVKPTPRLVVVTFQLTTPGGGVAGGTAMASFPIKWRPLFVYETLVPFMGYDSASGGAIPCYVTTSGFLVPAVGRAAGTTTAGAVTFVSDS